MVLAEPVEITRKVTRAFEKLELQVQRDRLDSTYLAEGAKRRGVKDLLERAWREAQIE